ncbi:hypothetical protein TL16_g08176 [Triparma laevis f. inornata]|uniref:Tyrosine-protein kinase ephrin type A/B receptor-like domain-containing protein n=1 Tax=Triparma laevis f. inornata TaxID=1714386 RepID=A0A9W7EHW5_9STRA|nr:hypothetical protein TL16_g08176 [Triparma laevis f. inornata]
MNCVCGAGFTFERGQCVLCGAGTYKNWEGNEACKSCDKTALKGSFSTWTSIMSAELTKTNGTLPPPISPLNCTCEKGDFQIDRPPLSDPDFEGHGYCSPCPEGANCKERGVQLATLPLKPNYWRSAKDSYNIELCFARAACPQVNVSEDMESLDSSQCLEGHYGPICNICMPKFAKNIMGVCQLCEGKVNIPLEAVLAFISTPMAALLCIFLIKRRNHMKGKYRKVKRTKSNFTRTVRTKFKILASFVQVISGYKNILNIRFPPAFEGFSRWLSSLVNLDALKLGSVDCFVATSFYTKLLFSTLMPLFMVACIFLYMSVAKGCAKDPQKKRRIHNNSIELFLGLTFLVFASVSTTIFDTFNCKVFGDDPTRYLALDQSLDCNDPIHKFYTMYAAVMVLLYPIGIPMLYVYLLVSHRHQIQAKDRAADSSLIKISFLWEMYEPRMWWFEFFECARRLGMSGLLIFFSSGSPSQIVVGMLLSLGVIVIYVHCKPFLEIEDDLLAVVSQLSIFVTLFGALLIRVKIDKSDGYDEAIFGGILIAVNLAGIAMVLSTSLIKPFQIVIKSFANHHKHDAKLKGLGHEHDDNDIFISYFETLALSSQEDSGFTDVPLHGVESAIWLSETHAKLEWRNSHGYGPIDEGRATFTVKCPLDEVKSYIMNTDCELHPGVIEHFEISTLIHGVSKKMAMKLKRLSKRRYRENRRILYTGRRLPFPLSNRDSLVEQFAQSSKLMTGAEVVVGRSIFDENVFSIKKSKLRGFSRADIHLKGYFLRQTPHDAENSTDVVFIAGVNANIHFGALIAERVAIKGLKKVVKNLQNLEEEDRSLKNGNGDGNRIRARTNSSPVKRGWALSLKLIGGLTKKKAGLADKDSMLEMKELAGAANAKADKKGGFRYLTNSATGTESSACLSCNTGQYSLVGQSSCNLCDTARGYTGTSPDCVAGPVTLSGESQGTCYVNGACFGTGSPGTYNNKESCTFTFNDAVVLHVGRFVTESDVDKLTMPDGTDYSGTSGPIDGSVPAGQKITWISNNDKKEAGFEICVSLKPPLLVVSGMCTSASGFNDVYEPMYKTASGRWYYKNDNGRYIYFDPSCDGRGGYPNQWIFDNTAPLTTEENDLDDCTAGKYSGSGSKGCVPCVAGTFASSTSSASCDDCPEGKYSEEIGLTSDECINCSAGKYGNKPGLDSDNNCTNCAEGKYNKGSGATSESVCSDCKEGSYSGLASETCTDCPAGKYSSGSHATAYSTCIDCSVGKFAGGPASSSCSDCIPGTFSNQIATITCTSCSGGKYSGTTGATIETTCTECEAGKYGTTGSESCTVCEVGKHSPASSSECISCTVGKISYPPATNAEDCFLNPHSWDFRNCASDSPVTDSIGLKATPMNGPTCSADGLSLDGNNDYVGIESWTWGGTTSFEVYVKYDSFNSNSRVFDFSNGANSDNIIMCNDETTSTFRWAVLQGSTLQLLGGSYFDSSTWTHVVVTVSGTTMKIYKNGALAGTKEDGHEPNVLTRSDHTIGAANLDGMDNFMDGTIAYVKMWHGVELQLSDVTVLYAPHNTAHHFWDFRGCTKGSAVEDSIARNLKATPNASDYSKLPECSGDGITFDGKPSEKQYVDIDDWEWGGTTSFEVYVKYHSFNENTRVFDFGDYWKDKVWLSNLEVQSAINCGTTLAQGSKTSKDLTAYNWDYTWTHIIVTIKDQNMRIYKNGALIGTKTDGQEPNVKTRKIHTLGAGAGLEKDGMSWFMDGTIAYFKIWHGVELNDSDVRTIYEPYNILVCPAGKYKSNDSAGDDPCEACPPQSTSLPPASQEEDCVPNTHFWDFRGCTDKGNISDSIGSSLVATPKNGPICGPGGITLDGNDDYIAITDWRWGGTTTIEVLFKYNNDLQQNSRVFDFGNGENNDNVFLKINDSNEFEWAFQRGPQKKFLSSSVFADTVWTHLIITVSDKSMKIHKNGNHTQTNKNTWVPTIVTRDNNWLGRGALSNNPFFNGTIAYFKIYHGKLFTDEEIKSKFDVAYNESISNVQCGAGTFNDKADRSSFECHKCAAGRFQNVPNQDSCKECADDHYSNEGASECIVCSAGKTHKDDKTTCVCLPGKKVSENGICEDCKVGKYTDAKGKTDCVRCELGKTSAQGSSACTSCVIGKIGVNNNGEGLCKVCSAGRYQDIEGQTNCNSCGSGRYQNENQATSCKGE